MRRATALLAVLALLIGGCGTSPSQAPKRAASRIADATNGISTTCAKAYRVTEFGGDHAPELDPLERTATSDARKLAGVYRRNRSWTYRAQTVAQIVATSASLLRDCALDQAAAVLERAAR